MVLPTLIESVQILASQLAVKRGMPCKSQLQSQALRLATLIKSELLTYSLYTFHYKKYLKSFLAMRYTLTF